MRLYPAKIKNPLLCECKSVKELVETINQYIRHDNENPKPFVWTKHVEEILEKVGHCKAATVTAH